MKTTFIIMKHPHIFKNYCALICALSFFYCASAGVQVKPAVTKKKVSSEVMSHIINGAVADLAGLSKEALFEYHQAAELDTTSSGIYLALAENYYLIEKYATAIRMAQKVLRIDPGNIDALEMIAVCYQKLDDYPNAMATVKRMTQNEPQNLEYLFNLVSLQIISKEYKQALKNYFSMVKKGLNDVEFRLRIGYLFLQQRAYAEAEQVYLDVYKSFPNHEAVYLALATVAKSTADTSRAVQWYQKALQTNPRFNDAKAELQLILEKKKLWDQAVTLYQDLVTRDSTNLTNKIQLGQYYLIQGDTASAVQYFNRIVREHPKSERSYLALAAVQKITGDTTAALGTYRSALAVKSNFYSARKKLSELYARQGQWQEALALYEAIQDNDTTHVGARIEIINLLAQKGDSATAFQECETLLKAHNDDWRVPLTLGRLAYASRRLPVAVKNFSKTVELRPDLPNLWVLQGITFLQMDSLAQAQETFQKALQRFPDAAQLHYYLGTVQVRLRLFSEAVNSLKKSAELEPDNPQTALALAGAYDELSMHDLSEPLYSKLLEHNPDNAVFLNNYAYHLSVRGIRLNEALEYVQKALEADPENPPYLDTLGWIYYQKGEYEQAKIYIEKALQSRADAPEVLEHMGDVLQKLGDQQSAEIYWKKAWQLDQTSASLQKKLGKTGQ